jgi:hypothetical protein
MAERGTSLSTDAALAGLVGRTAPAARPAIARANLKIIATSEALHLANAARTAAVGAHERPARIVAASAVLGTGLQINALEVTRRSAGVTGCGVDAFVIDAGYDLAAERQCQEHTECTVFVSSHQL